MVKKRLLTALMALMIFAAPCAHVKDSVPVPAVTTAYASSKFDLFDGIKADGGGTWTVGKKVSDSSTTSYVSIYNKYKNILVFLVGIILITVFGSMIFRFYKLSASGGNEMERKKAITGIMITGIVLALLGSFSIIVGIAYHLLG